MRISLQPLRILRPQLKFKCFNRDIRRNVTANHAHVPQKPFYITTPIFYVNADPHLGHMYSMILADVIKRWQELRGRTALLCTGIDEHGLKVQQAAYAANTSTQKFCDKGAQTFKDLADRSDISYTYFARTTSNKHKEAVQYAWMILKERGYIYEDKHEGWYSISDETFYPDNAIETVIDNVSGKKIQVSLETGKVVEWTSEVNYRFRLSKFRDKLLSLYDSNPEWIEPAVYMRDVRMQVKHGLTDLSISRPAKRVEWGIPVPHDNNQNIYVWLDALMNYIVETGYPWSPEQSTVGGWPADVHIIGKDIIRFHCIYWPAFLMALGISLPQKIIAHSHWKIGGEKMSKSTGNVVNPFSLLDSYGSDSIRWFLILEGNIAKDSDYNNLHLATKYDELRGKLGNFLSRLIRSRRWNVKDALRASFYDGQMNIASLQPETIKAHGLVKGFRDRLEPMIEKHDVRGVLLQIMDLVYEMNAWFHKSEPWRTISRNGSTNDRETQFIIALSAEALRIVGILIQPYMPGKARNLLDQLGVAEENRSWDHAILGGDNSYGPKNTLVSYKYQDVLFPPMSGL